MNLNWNWSWGSLSGLILGSQIVTGILLAMHYVGHVDHAFASVQHLMVDVPSGMILRYAHANGASLFFTVVYLHVLRGLYYSSGNQPREIVWISGVVILLLMIITAFIGYFSSQKWVFYYENYFISSFNGACAPLGAHALKHKQSLCSRASLFTTESQKPKQPFLALCLATLSQSSLEAAPESGHLLVGASLEVSDTNPLGKANYLEGFKFVKKYDNIHLKETQVKILNENKHKSGIYLLLNNKSTLGLNNSLALGCFDTKHPSRATKPLGFVAQTNDAISAYIGSASTNRINMRFRNHCIHGTGSSTILQRAINKYGLESFNFYILEYYPGFVHKENFKEAHLKLLELETYYIQLLKPRYNILQQGGSSLGYKHTEETKLNMKLNYSVIRKEVIGNLNKGKTLSLETKQLMSVNSKLKYLDAAYKEAFIQKNKDNLFKGKALVVLDLKLNVVSEYESVLAASKIFKCCRKTIVKYLNASPSKVFKKCYYLKYKSLTP